MSEPIQDQFDVRWNMQYPAAGPVDAARQALGDQRDPEGTLTVMVVTNMRTNERWVIDIEDPDAPVFIEGTPVDEEEGDDDPGPDPDPADTKGDLDFHEAREEGRA